MTRNSKGRIGVATCTALVLACASASAQAQQTPIDVINQFADSDSIRELGRAIGTLCPAGNRLSARLQADCNALVGAAFGGDAAVRAALRQIVPDAVNASIDRSQFGFGAPNQAGLRSSFGGQAVGFVDRHEGGVLSWMANLSAASFAQTAEFDRWSMFVNLDFANFERDPSFNEAGFDADRQAITLGLDRRFSDSFSAGVGLGFARNDMEFNGNSGSQDSDEQRLLAWANWSGANGAYFDLLGSWQRRDIDQVRRVAYTLGSGVAVDQRFSADYDGDVSALSLTLGRRWQRESMGIDPYINVEFAAIESDGYTERASSPDANGAGWAIVSPDIDSDISTASLGLRMDWAISSANGVWLPQVDLAWVHVLDQDEPSTPVTFDGDLSEAVQQALLRFAMINDEEDDSYARIGLGIVGQWTGGRSGFANVARHLGNGRYERTEFTLGFRWEF